MRIGPALIIVGIVLLAYPLASSATAASASLGFESVSYPSDAGAGGLVSISVTDADPSLERMSLVDEDGTVLADSFYHSLYPTYYSDFPQVNGAWEVLITMPDSDLNLTVMGFAEVGYDTSFENTMVGWEENKFDGGQWTISQEQTIGWSTDGY